MNAVAGLLTQSTPEDLLAALRGLERELGREPPRERWGPRVIDLDLLVVGREERATETLTLPHAGIAERDFVLYPLADIAPDLDVPGLGRVAVLRDRVREPRHRAPVSTPERRRRPCNGAAPAPGPRCRRSVTSWSKGRSVSARPASRAGWRRLSKPSWCSSRTRRTRSSNVSIAIRSRARLPAQLFFLFQRAQQLGTLKQQDMFAPRRVADYLFEKDRLFAGLTLDAAEMALYEQVASRLAVDPPKPDLVVYLQAPVETLLQRIARRGTSYESLIDAPYLTRLNDAYARFFHEFDRAPLLIVNAASIDPVQNQADYEELVGAIRRMKKGRMYYNPLRHGTI